MHFDSISAIGIEAFIHKHYSFFICHDFEKEQAHQDSLTLACSKYSTTASKSKSKTKEFLDSIAHD